jgi:hypothetical protein
MAAPLADGPSLSDAEAIPADRVAPFAITTSGLLQFQYDALIRQGKPRPAESGVSLRRARFAAEGEILSPRFTLRAELSADQGVLAPLDVYAEGRSRLFTLRAGQMRVPFSASWMTGDQKLLFADRSIATEMFRYDYDLGILLILHPRRSAGRFVAMVGGFNGAGKNVAGNDNVDPMLLLRIAGTPIGQPSDASEADLVRSPAPSFTIGGSATIDYVPAPNAYGYSSGFPLPPVPIAVRDGDMNGRVDGVRAWQAEADLDFRWRGVVLQGEAYVRDEQWFNIGQSQPVGARFLPKKRFTGGFGQVSYRLPWVPVVPSVRVSSTLLSPLVLGGRTPAAQICVGADGSSFPCALTYADRRRERSITVAYFAHAPGPEPGTNGCSTTSGPGRCAISSTRIATSGSTSRIHIIINCASGKCGSASANR